MSFGKEQSGGRPKRSKNMVCCELRPAQGGRVPSPRGNCSIMIDSVKMKDQVSRTVATELCCALLSFSGETLIETSKNIVVEMAVQLNSNSQHRSCVKSNSCYTSRVRRESRCTFKLCNSLINYENPVKITNQQCSKFYFVHATKQQEEPQFFANLSHNKIK